MMVALSVLVLVLVLFRFLVMVMVIVVSHRRRMEWNGMQRNGIEWKGFDATERNGMERIRCNVTSVNK